MALLRNSDLSDDLGLLASALELLEVGVEDPRKAERLARTRDRLARSIRSYLIPRVSGEGTPLSVVFAGPTGSGKSTLVNSLSGLEVSETGPIRPTTKDPVVLASTTHARRYETISGIRCEVVPGHAPILDRMALIDTPDIDSTTLENRVAAEVLIDNADIVVFTTSALRYADMVPWEVLRRAASRGAPIVNVLNRVTAGSTGAAVDFRALLLEEGLESSIVRVPEHHLERGEHKVPALAVRELQKRLVDLATDVDRARRDIFHRVLDSTTDQVLRLADEMEAAITNDRRRIGDFHQLFDGASKELDLQGLYQRLSPLDPPSGRLSRLWWRWRNRVSDEMWAEFCEQTHRRMGAIVESDVRKRVHRAGVDSPMPSSVTEHLRALTGEAADGWLAQLSVLTRGLPRHVQRLAAVALAQASTSARRLEALDAVLLDEPHVSEARSALLDGLDPVYMETARQLVSSSELALFQSSDTDRLREVAMTVAARSQFADA